MSVCRKHCIKLALKEAPSVPLCPGETVPRHFSCTRPFHQRAWIDLQICGGLMRCEPIHDGSTRRLVPKAFKQAFKCAAAEQANVLSVSH